MIHPKIFYDWLTGHNIQFYSGVPDSLLKDLCAYITDNTSKQNHIIAANEGNAIALAAGNHLATGNIPLVYMQNSGIGNAINPLLSLVDKQVYKIPVLLMIGWRGEPGVKDEPQHITQGEVTLSLLEALKIPYLVLDKDAEIAGTQVQDAIDKIKISNAPFAIVIKKGTFEKYSIQTKLNSNYELSREVAIEKILDTLSGNEVIVSTTGKTSRELFECRASRKQPHDSDFLTVGSMGHASQIALGIAMSKPEKKVICLDGDGATLMHMGGLAIIGKMAPKNFIHIVMNNGAHESVGGQPTVGFDMDIPAVARAAQYKSVQTVSTAAEIAQTIKMIDEDLCPAFIEVKVKVGSRSDLGRPTIKPEDNKGNFMKNLGG